MFQQTHFDWLEEFDKVCEAGDAVAITNHLVQLGVTNPQYCDCDSVLLKDPVLKALHDEHKNHNTTAHFSLMRHKALLKVRMVLREDLKVVNRYGNDIYGHIVLHSYGRWLLDNFLLPQPSLSFVNAHTEMP